MDCINGSSALEEPNAVDELSALNELSEVNESNELNASNVLSSTVFSNGLFYVPYWLPLCFLMDSHHSSIGLCFDSQWALPYFRFFYGVLHCILKGSPTIAIGPPGVSIQSHEEHGPMTSARRWFLKEPGNAIVHSDHG